MLPSLSGRGRQLYGRHEFGHLIAWGGLAVAGLLKETAPSGRRTETDSGDTGHSGQVEEEIICEGRWAFMGASGEPWHP